MQNSVPVCRERDIDSKEYRNTLEDGDLGLGLGSSDGNINSVRSWDLALGTLKQEVDTKLCVTKETTTKGRSPSIYTRILATRGSNRKPFHLAKS